MAGYGWRRPREMGQYGKRSWFGDLGDILTGKGPDYFIGDLSHRGPRSAYWSRHTDWNDSYDSIDSVPQNTSLYSAVTRPIDIPGNGLDSHRTPRWARRHGKRYDPETRRYRSYWNIRDPCDANGMPHPYSSVLHDWDSLDSIGPGGMYPLGGGRLGRGAYQRGYGRWRGRRARHGYWPPEHGSWGTGHGHGHGHGHGSYYDDVDIDDDDYCYSDTDDGVSLKPWERGYWPQRDKARRRLSGRRIY
ncbi:MAG: hypothetical protein M1825_000790 [Sarcosagium campestre]|nr:MAG: hypothetical protein M1825_000790 [Sarcosagium campestre]